MPDICAYLIFRQRREMKSEPRALRQLFQLRRIEGVIEFRLPRQNDTQDFFSAATDVIFGYFPARRAASLNPIDALRHE